MYNIVHENCQIYDSFAEFLDGLVALSHRRPKTKHKSVNNKQKHTIMNWYERLSKKYVTSLFVDGKKRQRKEKNRIEYEKYGDRL